MKKNFFTFLPVENGQQNWFDLSHSNSGSCNMGGLYPVVVEPTLPGDYFTCDISYLMRMAQMVAPPMTRIGISFFPFYCPNRILMDGKDWDKFIADVDGTSGISLPSLSFSTLFTYIQQSVPIEDVLGFVAPILEFDVNTDLNGDYEFRVAGSLIEGGMLVYDVYNTQEQTDRVVSRLAELGISVTDTTTVTSVLTSVSALYKDYPFKGTLLDYMGFPVNAPLFSTEGMFNLRIIDQVVVLRTVERIATTRSVQILPIIAYLRIWNEYFRQEFIQEEIDESLIDNFNEWKELLGSDLSILWTVKRRDWEHDYFTSCLPAPQLGEASSITIGEDGKFTIPELREGNILQRIREKLLHGGTRVWEIVANFFSERVSDSRIQIPEYIRPDNRTGFSWLRVSDIYQTAPGSSDSIPTLDPSANIAAPRGAAVNTNTGVRFKFKAEEHGYLIVLMNIQPEPVYCQGIPRHYLSLDTLDYGWPDFANITEQPVYQYEIYATPDNARKVLIDDPNAPEARDYPIFGWQSQYAWYKFHNSELHGELRDDLDFFTFARIFDSEPYLNSEFLTCNPSDRPFPVTYEYDKLTYHLAIDLRVNRRLPYYGIPSLR